MTVIGRLCLIFLTMILLSVSAPAQNTVGKIIDLKGTARRKHADGKVENLIEKKDFVRDLQPGQKLRVDKNGQMQIALCDGQRPSIPSDNWYPVPSTIICSTAADSPLKRLLIKVFIVGGRRGDQGFIFFPIESETLVDIVRPESVILRWSSSPPRTVDLSISVIGVENITWTRNGIVAEDGSFTDDDLKSFLKAVREKYPDARLQLKTRADLKTNTAIFQLLSKEKEAALQQELANLKEENELLSHLFRAQIYARYMLFPEAANEHEEALKLSPESIELLKDTAAMEEQAGNFKRYNELKTFIKKLSEPKE